MDDAGMGALHHVELWVPNLTRAEASWGWLFGELGYKVNGEWTEGKSWQSGSTYIVLEQSPARIVVRHDRLRPGLNHLAFYAASREQVDSLAANAGEHGWRLLFADRHPYAGGPDHYAAYLEDRDGFEVELVAPAAV
jgi:catechol 2,3-dioxygenase-like lactoylglutathione lyase family enzyme